MTDIIQGMRQANVPYPQRREMYRILIPAMQDCDWDTEMDNLDDDPAFDAELESLHPDWFPDEGSRGPVTHDLRVWPAYFQPVFDDLKRFEGRRDDREFQVGDVLQLREWREDKHEYTGRECFRVITFKLAGGDFGIADDWCVLSIKPTEQPSG